MALMTNGDALNGKISNGHSESESLTTKTNKNVRLKKQISLFQAVCIIVGIIIGSGIFVSPVGILQNVKSVGMSCVMWTVTGVFSALCALCFAELGACIPKSGGEYTYIREAFGDFFAFLALWINFIIICPVCVAASCLIFATYILKPVYSDCDPPFVAVRLIAALIIALLISINCINVRWAAKVQVGITVCKLVALATIVIIGFVYLGKGKVDNFKDSFADSDYSAGAIAISFYSGFWAFGGWSYLNFLTDELIEPHRNLPRAIIISMAIVTSVYLVANIAYFAVLTPIEMLQSTAVAVTFSEMTVPVMSVFVPILIAISVAGSMNGTSLSMSRLFFVGASNNHLPSIVAMINYKFLTPAPSLITILVLTLLMQSLGDVFYLIEMMGFSFTTVLAFVFAGQIYMRITRPDIPRPIKLPLVLPIFLFVMSLVLLVLTCIQKPDISLLAFCLTMLGVPCYVLGIYWKSKPAGFNRLNRYITSTIQKVLLVVPQDDEIEW
ncbi:cystine/glutamate transporter-like [Pecten maximus]|uniref:cystine/glutamate transporter-like n=1 Tax=Pecten maximus TaxID=6579 RepID=UPI001458FC43|nr:cystine/glutamate transporter-like [Pecten maximus]XP_033742945.1 cystine/glutamate transporter-like [Pecten maximus]XP_033742946.1 cystine/glutamate transporter-like [Pecten maximus]